MLDINLSTILLQMANFFLLVFILYRFLFKPLQEMMKKRAEETMRALDDAHIAQVEAIKVQQEYEEKTNNINVEIAARKNEARIVIEQNRQQMLHEVQTEIEQIRSQTASTLKKMQMEAIHDHKNEIGFLASEFTTNMLSDLMNPNLQETYQEQFLSMIKQEDLTSFMKETKPGRTVFIKIILAVPPSQTYQERLEATLHQSTTQALNLSFEVDPKLIAGGILRFENELIDGSLQGQINRLQKKYQEN